MNGLRIGLAGWVVAILLAGCAQEVDMGAGEDRKAEIDGLLQADREFAALSEQEGYVEAYRRYSTEEVLLLPPGSEPRRGREQIYREDMEEGLLGDLRWMPQDGYVAVSDDLGWTWGRWTFAVEGEGGAPQSSFGKYVFVWRKVAGEWRVAVNIWNDNPEA